MFGLKKADENFKLSLNTVYGEGDDFKNPYISPVYGHFEDLPPMLIQAGSNEVLLSDSTRVVEKAEKAGTSVKLIEYPGMFHVFYVAMPFLEESKEAWKEINLFLDDLS